MICYRTNFTILFRKCSLRHRFTFYVQNSRKSTTGKWIKNVLFWWQKQKNSENAAICAPFCGGRQKCAGRVLPEPTSPCKISSQSVPVCWSYFREKSFRTITIYAFVIQKNLFSPSSRAAARSRAVRQRDEALLVAKSIWRDCICTTTVGKSRAPESRRVKNQPTYVIHTSTTTSRAGSAAMMYAGDETWREIHCVTSLFASVLFVISVMAGAHVFHLVNGRPPAFTWPEYKMAPLKKIWTLQRPGMTLNYLSAVPGVASGFWRP